jgi:hypothetical protein
MQLVQALVAIRCYLLGGPATGITRMKFAAWNQAQYLDNSGKLANIDNLPK